MPLEAIRGQSEPFPARRRVPDRPSLLLRSEDSVPARVGGSDQEHGAAFQVDLAGLVVGFEAQAFFEVTERRWEVAPVLLVAVDSGREMLGQLPLQRGGAIPKSEEFEYRDRYVLALDSDQVERTIEEVLSCLHQKHPAADILFKLENEVMAMHTPEGSEIEKNLREVVNDYDIHAAPYTTEGGIISHFGVDCIICGSGSIKNAHQSNEFMSKEDIFKGIDVIKAIIERMCF